MADDAQRGVTFTLKAEVDQQLKAEFDKLTQMLTQAQEKLASAAASAAQQSSAAAATTATAAVQTATATVQTATKQIVDEEERSAKEIVESWTSAFTQSASSAQQQAAVVTQTAEFSAEQVAERLRQLEAERSEIRRVSSDKERADYIHAQLALVDITRRRIEAEDALIEAQDRGDKKENIRDASSYVIQLGIEEIRVAEEVAKNKTLFFEAEKKERAFLLDQQIQGLRETQTAQERAAAATRRNNQQIGSSVSRVVSSISEGSEALMRFVNGFQQLGLVGEKDLQKVQDAIMRMQGVTGVFTGLIRMFRQASEGIDAYRRILELTSAAQTASAAATAVDTVATAANTQAHAANVAVRAAGDVPMTSRVAMGAARIGSSIAGAGEAIGIGAGSAAGLTVFGAAVAALAGVLFAAVSAVNTFREALTFGIGGGAKEGGMVEKIGTSSWNPFARAQTTSSLGEAAGVVTRGFLDPFNLFGFDKKTSGEKKLDDESKAEKARLEFRQRSLELQREAEREINQISSERQGIVAKQHAAEQEVHSARLQSLKPEERRSELVKEIHRAEKDQSMSAEERGRKVIDIQKQRLAVEKEINREQTQAAKEQLRSLEDQSRLKEKEFERAKSEAMSAAERFGLMSGEEQQSLIETRRRFQAGAGNVETEDLKKLRGFSGALDEQIAAESRRRAGAAGFGEFQTEDLRRIQQLDQERQQLEVKVKAQADVVAKLEVDIDSVARSINKQIEAQWKQVLEAMATQIATLQGKQTEVETRIARRFGSGV